jgi:hypothetical protein
MNTPAHIQETRLWQVLERNSELAGALLQMRKTAARIGAMAATVVPDYTDHSVDHMDALWRVCEAVFLEEETARFTIAEAFVLGCAFYVHDLGMAFAATPEGLARIKDSAEYNVARLHIGQRPGVSPERADLLAVRAAVRDLHAKNAVSLVTDRLPGIDAYLLDNTGLRHLWASHIGEVAASHHWNLVELDAKLGRRIVPTDGLGQLDLAFVACALRLIDYAHVNHERASYLDRALRSEIDVDSIIHWESQAHISGPSRRDDWLVYGSNTPIANVDAWWLFYDIACGIDAEIRAVRDYLDERNDARGRFSLHGVRGTGAATDFAELVQLGGRIVPIDIRVQPESMDRLVDLLGGKAIYGDDLLAPVRELLQNARDAIVLLQKLKEADGLPCESGQIEVSLTEEGEHVWLRVKDNGVGMSRSVITRHLIGIASDYWHSAEFFRDYARAVAAGFRPIGRFGIGFLSVFMLGEHIVVETEGMDHRYKLRLRGVGRRGELIEEQRAGNRGTSVSVQLSADKMKHLSRLESIVRSRAPMLEIPIVVKWTEEGSQREATISPGWWKHLADDRMDRFVGDWRLEAWYGGVVSEGTQSRFGRRERRAGSVYVSDEGDLMGWPGLKPKVIADDRHILSRGGTAEPGILRCSNGIAVDVIHCGDLYGVLEVGDIELTAARSQPAGYRHDGLHGVPPVFLDDEDASSYGDPAKPTLASMLHDCIRAEIVAKLDDMGCYGMLPARLAFLRSMARQYGISVLCETRLRWLPILEPPGDTVHRSHADLVARLKNEDRVICATGATSAAVYAFLTNSGKEELSQVPTIAISIREFDLSYTSGQDLAREYKNRRVQGTLADVCRIVRVKRRQLVLLSAALQIVGEAWNTPSTVLGGQKWIADFKEYKGEFLLGLLERPNAAV